MNEQDLRKYLGMLGIKVEGRNPKPNKIWLNFCCPVASRHWKHGFKADRHPSAGAVADTTGNASRWMCYACKSHGTIASLARTLEREDVAELAETTEQTGMAAIDFMAEAIGPERLGDPLIEEMYEDLYEPAWQNPVSRAYLQGRRISQVTAEDLELVFDPQIQRLMFPVRDRDGGLHGWSRRAVHPDQQPKIIDQGLPKRHLILGSHRWRPGLPLVLVEGLFAYARQIENGVEEIANTGALLGSVLTPEKAQIVTIFDAPTYLLLDNDAAGDIGIFGQLDERGRREPGTGAIALLKDHVPLFIPTYPDGKSDPDDLTFSEIETMLQETTPFGFEILR